MFFLEWTREAPAKLLFFSPAHGTMTKDSHLLLMSQTMVCAIKDLCYDYKDLMTDPMGNSLFCFPETPSGLQGKTVWNIKSQGETKLAIFLWGQSFKIVLLIQNMQPTHLPWWQLTKLLPAYRYIVVACLLARQSRTLPIT